MARLRDRITGIFGKRKPDVEQTTLALDREPERPSELAQKFTAETSRAGIVRTCRKMYASDPRAKKMIRSLARDLVKGGYVLRMGEGASATPVSDVGDAGKDAPLAARAFDVAEALRERLKLDKRLDDWVRLSARDGDSFLETVINQNLEIVDVSRKPTLEMSRNSNKYDLFEDPDKAFWWADQMFIGQDPPRDAIWFPEWQIIHARWDHDEGSRYGEPMLASGTGHWKKVTEGELDVAIRRKTRAGKRYVHKFPEGTDESAILEYMERNKPALDEKFAALADFFGTVEIKSVEGDMHLGEIKDVQHMIATWFTAGDVPMELIAYGEGLNRDILGEKKEQYDEMLEQQREWVSDQLIQPLLERQWLLAGILPEGLDYKIEWKQKRQVTAADVKDIAEAAMRLRLIGVPEEVVVAVLMQFLPGVDMEMLTLTGDGGQGALRQGSGQGGDAGRLGEILQGLESRE